jgi:hypothetical protein
MHRFFYRNKHIMIDLGTGNNNKINWAMDDKQEVRFFLFLRSRSLSSSGGGLKLIIGDFVYAQLIDIVETVYRGASKGRGLVVSPRGPFSIFLLLPFHSFPFLSIALPPHSPCLLTLDACFPDYSTRLKY